MCCWETEQNAGRKATLIRVPDIPGSGLGFIMCLNWFHPHPVRGGGFCYSPSFTDEKSEASLKGELWALCLQYTQLFRMRTHSKKWVFYLETDTHTLIMEMGFPKWHTSLLREMHWKILFYSFPLFNDSFNGVNCCHSILMSPQLKFEKHSARICYNLIWSPQNQSSQVKYEF